jgi:hypothetical protein
MYNNRELWQELAGRRSSYASFSDSSEWSAGAGYSYGLFPPNFQGPRGGNDGMTWQEFDAAEARRAEWLRNHPNEIAQRSKSNYGRYVALNLQNRHTIELRFWRPSLIASTVLAAMEATEASVEYTRGLKYSPSMKDGSLTMQALADWADTQDGRYNNFVRRANQRGCVTGCNTTDSTEGDF